METEIRYTPAGMIAVRGNRELHLLGNSVDAVNRSRRMLAENSFDRLYRSAKASPIRNVRFFNNKTS